MKRGKRTAAMAWFMCAVMLVFGTLLVLHADHICHDHTCVICPILARCMEIFLCALAVFTAAGFSGDTGMGRCYGPPENRTVPEWTLVQRKVKLLN